MVSSMKVEKSTFKNASVVIAMCIEILVDLEDNKMLGYDRASVIKLMRMLSTIGLSITDTDFLDKIHDSIEPICREKIKEIKKEGKNKLEDWDLN